MSGIIFSQNNGGPSADDIPVVPINILPISPTMPTIPTLDPMHAPKIRNNIFGIDLGGYIGDSEVTVRTTFQTKHKWYGQDWFDEKGAMGYGVNYRFPTIETIPGTFYFDILSWSPMGSTDSYAASKAKQNNYKVYYVQDFFEEEKHWVQLTISETYYDLTNADDGDDGQEFGVGIALPGLFDFGEKGVDDGQLVPSIYGGKIWNLKLDQTNSFVNEYDGSVYVFGLDYYSRLQENIVGDAYMKLNYKEGLNVNNNDFTDVTVGLLTDIEIGQGTILTPSINYIYYLDDSLLDNNKGDSEVWAGLTIRYNF